MIINILNTISHIEFAKYKNNMGRKREHLRDTVFVSTSLIFWVLFFSFVKSF